MPTTTILALPYPANGDLPDGPAVVQALAQEVEDTLAPRHARYRLNVAQSIASGADGTMYLPQALATTPEVVRTLGTATTGSTFTLGRAGLWHLSADVRWVPVAAGSASTSERYMGIYNNTAGTRLTHAGVVPGAVGPTSLACSTIARLDSGTVVRVGLYQSSGGAVGIDTGFSDTTMLSMTWIGP